jgi:hypothetical protein
MPTLHTISKPGGLGSSVRVYSLKEGWLHHACPIVVVEHTSSGSSARACPAGVALPGAYAQDEDIRKELGVFLINDRIRR